IFLFSLLSTFVHNTVAPVFKHKIQPLEVSVGNRAKFECEIEEAPNVKFKWYKAGIEVRESEKCKIFSHHLTTSMELLNLTKADTGEYTCKATNQHGSDSCSAFLNVSVFPPVFTTKPEPMTLYVGKQASIQCVVTGSTPLSVVWQKDNVSISSGENYRASVDKNRYTLEIVKLQVADQGTYICKASNIVGTDMCCTELSVIDKPSFVKTLTPMTVAVGNPLRLECQSLTVVEGQSAKFTCDVDGIPTPTVTWIQEGEIIVSSQRHHVITTQYKSTFEIFSVQLSDEGSYTLVVENSGGKQEVQFSLTISRSSPKDKISASPTKVKSSEPTEKSSESTGIIPLETHVMSPEVIKFSPKVKSPEPATSSQRDKSPALADSPTPQKIEMPKTMDELKVEASGGKVSITCVADSNLNRVIWFKDGNKLIQDSRHHFHTSSDGTCTLSILGIAKSDEGEYACEVVSEKGVSRASFSFVGRVFESIYSKMTNFTEPEKQGHDIKFNSFPLKQDLSAGSTDVKELQLQTKKEAYTGSCKKPETTEQIVEKMLQDEVQPCTEMKTFHHQLSMAEGKSITLKANIPNASTVRWTLNGEELLNSGEYRYGVSGNDHTLTIKNVSQHEEGIITCEAKTEEGIVKCQFDTTVTSKRANAPSFLVQPKSQNVNEGQNVIFTCEITGDPTPEIEWLKNNVLVSAIVSELIFHYIKEASISDSGKYTVKAKNMYGQCSATASLNVLGKLLFFFMHHDLGIISVHEQVVSMKFVLANICMTIKKS
uniref:Ig-like domain-containing protein n=1 Tax=Scleropages formosus TaxID=113540 RepID=A0A8C9TJ71_SCLFO